MQSFPQSFHWGAATSSYQIEGAAFADGKGKCIWDTFVEQDGAIQDGTDGRLACDHYTYYRDDVKLLKELNFSHYRFSVNWARIMPDGKGRVNEAGLDFYKRLINTLNEQHITPMLTLYHWELPQQLEDEGGWLNRDTAYYFAEYAERVFREFSAEVPYWITQNEPWVASRLGYGEGVHAPGKKGLNHFLTAAHHLLLSHGLATERLRAMKQTEQQTGIALNLSSHYPADDRPSSQEAATRADGFLNRWFLDPVYKGTYPKDMLTIYEKQTDLSFLQQGDLEQIQQPIDFLGINYYSSDFVESSPVTTENPTGSKPVQTSLPKTAMEWDVYPDGLYDLLVRVTNDYGKQPLYVSENGAAYRDEVVGGEVNDEQRADYLDQHLQSCLRAIQSGVDLRGYYVWSFLDNFEWAYGLSKRFGVVHIDFTTLKRTPKQSAYWLQAFIASQRVHS